MIFVSSQEENEDRLLVCGERESHTQVSCQPATPEQWQMNISSGIRWTLWDRCFLLTQSHNFSFQDALSIAVSLALLRIFPAHTFGEINRYPTICPVSFGAVVVLLFKWWPRHGRFSVWSGWISLYDCKLPALNAIAVARLSRSLSCTDYESLAGWRYLLVSVFLFCRRWCMWKCVCID